MRSNFGWRQVITRQRFGRNEQAIWTLQGKKPRQKSRRQLPVPVTYEPYFGQLRVRRTKQRVPRRARNLEVALVEYAVARWLRLRGGQEETRRNDLGLSGGCWPAPEFTIQSRK